MPMRWETFGRKRRKMEEMVSCRRKCGGIGYLVGLRGHRKNLHVIRRYRNKHSAMRVMPATGKFRTNKNYKKSMQYHKIGNEQSKISMINKKL